MTNAQLLSQLPIPDAFIYEGVAIEIQELGYDSHYDLLVVEALINNEITETFLFKNPPIRVPDGTTKTVKHRKHGAREVSRFKESPDEALVSIVGDSAKTFLAHLGL